MVWLAAAAVLLLGALTGATLLRQDDDWIASVNGMRVEPGEFALLLAQERTRTALRFKTAYGAAASGDSFWTTPYGGATPADYAKQAALQRLIRLKLEQRLALERGVDAPADYSEYLRRWRHENERRKEALKTGAPLYGPVQYEEWNYYDYLHTNMVAALKEKLKDSELHVSEQEARDAYEQRKESRYRLAPEATVELLSFPAAAREQAEGAAAMLRAGASFAEARAAYASALLPNGPAGEAVKLGAARSEEPSEAEERLLQAALELKPGEAAAVSDANAVRVVRLIALQTQGYRPFDEVKEALRGELADRRYEELIERLQAQAAVETNRAAYERVKVS